MNRSTLNRPRVSTNDVLMFKLTLIEDLVYTLFLPSVYGTIRPKANLLFLDVGDHESRLYGSIIGPVSPMAEPVQLLFVESLFL